MRKIQPDCSSCGERRAVPIKTPAGHYVQALPLPAPVRIFHTPFRPAASQIGKARSARSSCSIRTIGKNAAILRSARTPSVLFAAINVASSVCHSQRRCDMLGLAWDRRAVRTWRRQPRGMPARWRGRVGISRRHRALAPICGPRHGSSGERHRAEQGLAWWAFAPGSSRAPSPRLFRQIRIPCASGRRGARTHEWPLGSRIVDLFDKN